MFTAVRASPARLSSTPLKMCFQFLEVFRKSSEKRPIKPKSLIHEVVDKNGFRSYPGEQPLGRIGPHDKDHQGLAEGQCMCCYYRKREILERTEGGLALFTPGWYWDETPVEGGPREGLVVGYAWWHGLAPHGNPGMKCGHGGPRKYHWPGHPIVETHEEKPQEKPEEKSEDDHQNLENQTLEEISEEVFVASRTQIGTVPSTREATEPSL